MVMQPWERQVFDIFDVFEHDRTVVSLGSQGELPVVRKRLVSHIPNVERDLAWSWIRQQAGPHFFSLGFPIATVGGIGAAALSG